MTIDDVDDGEAYAVSGAELRRLFEAAELLRGDGPIDRATVARQLVDVLQSVMVIELLS